MGAAKESETPKGGTDANPGDSENRLATDTDKPKVPEDKAQTENRLMNFADFFKRYMSISAIIVAALPIPVTSLHLIPTYSFQTGVLSVYTPLFCFLLFGFIFYNRIWFARRFFYGTRVEQKRFQIRVWRFVFVYLEPGQDNLAAVPSPTMRYSGPALLIGLLPILLTIASLGCALRYHYVLSNSIQVQKPTMSEGCKTTFGSGNASISDCILSSADMADVPEALILMEWYLGIFITAESAFVIMALKEWLQDVERVTDLEIIHQLTEAPQSPPKAS